MGDTSSKGDRKSGGQDASEADIAEEKAANGADENGEEERPKRTWDDWLREITRLISEGKDAGVSRTVLVHAKTRVRQHQGLQAEKDEAASELSRLLQEGPLGNRKKHSRQVERALQKVLRAERMLGVDYVFEV